MRLAVGILAAFVLVSTSACAPESRQPAFLTSASGPTGGRAATTEGTRIGATVRAPISLTPTQLHWGPLPPMLVPGGKMAVVDGDPFASDALYTLRVWLPPNYRIMPHWHPTDEHVTVLSGTLLVGHGDVFARDQTITLPAESFAVMPANHHHFAGTGDAETIIQIHGVGPFQFNYVDPADDPRIQQRPH